jgi:hypothetical protein
MTIIIYEIIHPFVISNPECEIRVEIIYFCGANIILARFITNTRESKFVIGVVYRFLETVVARPCSRGYRLHHSLSKKCNSVTTLRILSYNFLRSTSILLDFLKLYSQCMRRTKNPKIINNAPPLLQQPDHSGRNINFYAWCAIFWSLI